MNDKMGQRLQEIIDNWGAYTEWQTAYKRRKNKSGDKAWIWHGKLYRANMGRHYWCVKTPEDYACVMGVAQRYTYSLDRRRGVHAPLNLSRPYITRRSSNNLKGWFNSLICKRVYPGLLKK